MQHLLPKELRTFRYYEKKLPLWLRNDDCFIEHFKIWYELCMGEGDESDQVAISEFKGVSPSSDLILYLLDIYDPDFLENIRALDGDDDPTTSGQFDLIDKLGELFGLRRKFSIDYFDKPTDTTKTSATLTLDDADYVTLIKAQIIRNYCDGSYEQVMSYYNDAGLQILPVNNSEYPASVDAYLNANTTSANVEILFKAGLLTVEHLGIRYTYTVSDILNTLIWASDDATGQQNWDEGVWAV